MVDNTDPISDYKRFERMAQYQKQNRNRRCSQKRSTQNQGYLSNFTEFLSIYSNL